VPNYSKSAASALKLLTKFGQNVTRRAYTIGTYDPSTGLVTNTYADTTRKGVLLDFAAGQTLERGTLIQNGDKRLYVDSSATISPQDHFIVNTIEYTIVSIGEINPAGTSILYDLHLRT
jgi:hypothetical protein